MAALPPVPSELLLLAGTAALGAVVLALLWWQRAAVHLQVEKQLRVRVERIADPAALRQRRRELDTQRGLLALVDVDAGAAPLAPGTRLLSLGDYFASLRTHGQVSWERALVSISDHYGLMAALPLALFLPNRWRQECAAGGLLAGFPSLAATLLVTKAISTLDFVALGNTLHLFVSQRRRLAAENAAAAAAAAAASAAKHSWSLPGASKAAAAAAAAQAGQAPQQQQEQEQQEQQVLQNGQPAGPLDILRAGGKFAAGADPLGTAPPGPVLLTPASALQLLGLSPEEAADERPAPAPEPRPLSPYLPDLYLGSGGLQMSHSRAGAARCDLLAAVANRLAANALAGLPAAAPGGAAAAEAQQGQQGQQAEPFAVRLRPGGPPLSTLEDLLDGLEDGGHAVSMRLATNLTSFGLGLSVREADGSWSQVPVAYPMRCAGLYAEDEEGAPVDVVALDSHGSIRLSVRGPLAFDLEWCLSVQGFTGWGPDVAQRRDWANGAACTVDHPLLPDSAAAGEGGGLPGASRAARRRLLRLVTAATCAANAAAQRNALLFGGYGHLGVCLDSVAVLQQALLGRTTIFPLLLGGEAKFALMSVYLAAEQAGWAYSEEAATLQAALAALPCDALQEPATAAAAARRALATLPERSAFTAVAACRRTLQAAHAAAERLCSPEAVAAGG